MIAEHHIVDGKSPLEPENPLTTAVRANNESQGQIFVRIYPRSQFLDFFLWKPLYRGAPCREPVHFCVPSGRLEPLIKTPYNHPARCTELGHQVANDSLTTRCVAKLARLLYASKIVACNFPS